MPIVHFLQQSYKNLKKYPKLCAKDNTSQTTHLHIHNRVWHRLRRHMHSVRFTTGQAQALCILPVQELQWNDAHTHQAGSEYPVVRFGQYSPDTLSGRAMQAHIHSSTLNVWCAGFDYSVQQSHLYLYRHWWS